MNTEISDRILRTDLTCFLFFFTEERAKGPVFAALIQGKVFVLSTKRMKLSNKQKSHSTVYGKNLI